MRPRRGILFVLSAPSGAGKTTLAREAVNKIPALELSISLTTRAPRKGEVDGVDYYFVSEAEFKQRLARGELAEHANVFGAWYGTLRLPLERAIAEGRDMLLDIDVQGARQISALYGPDVVRIFVIPPTFAVLEIRLRQRATEDEVRIQERLARARAEYQAYPEYDYLIINSERTEAVKKLWAVAVAERLKVSRLSRDFAPWN